MPEQRFPAQLAKHLPHKASHPDSESSPRTRDLPLQIVHAAILLRPLDDNRFSMVLLGIIVLLGVVFLLVPLVLPVKLVLLVYIDCVVDLSYVWAHVLS